MKTKIVVAAMAFGMFALALVSMPTKQVVAKESSSRCSWTQSDCRGWFNGSYEACLEGGDGNSCTCGKRTRDC